MLQLHMRKVDLFTWPFSHDSEVYADKFGIVALTDISRARGYPPRFIRVHLRTSKTDLYGKGVHIYFGETKHSICPVSAILSYMTVRPLLLSDPFIHYPDGTILTRNHLVCYVKRALLRMDLIAWPFSHNL